MFGGSRPFCLFVGFIVRYALDIESDNGGMSNVSPV